MSLRYNPLPVIPLTAVPADTPVGSFSPVPSAPAFSSASCLLDIAANLSSPSCSVMPDFDSSISKNYLSMIL